MSAAAASAREMSRARSSAIVDFWWLAMTASAAVLSVWPLPPATPGRHLITIHGTGFGGYDAASLRCCWDHHPGYLPSQLVASNTSFPERSTSTVIGGDGVPDVETPVDSISTVSGGQQLVCSSYASVPGYTHTDDLLLAFGGAGSCNSTSLLDTRADFQFWVDPAALQLEAVLPRGGPVAGGTAVVVAGAGYGGRWLRCRFGRTAVDATYEGRRALRAAAPPAAEAGAVALAVTSDGGDEWTRPLRFTYYETAPPALSSVWPIGGPAAGGTHITVRGRGERPRGRRRVRGRRRRPRRRRRRRRAADAREAIVSADGSVETVLVATTAAVGADDAPAVGGAQRQLAGGGFDDGG